MDCGSAFSATGINPKFLNNWQTDSAFPFSAWEQPQVHCEQLSEWDTSQDSSPRVDALDPSSLHGSLNGDHPDVPLLDRPSGLLNNAGFSSNQDMSPESFGLAEGPIEGTVSSAVSPRTLASSSDENLEGRPPFRLFNPLTMQTESPFLYPYAKRSHDPSSNPLVVEDAGELAQGSGFADSQFHRVMPFQQMPQPFPFLSGPSPWADTTPAAATAGNVTRAQEPAPLPTASQLETEDGQQSLCDFQDVLGSLKWQWLDGLETQLPVNPSAAASCPPVPDTVGGIQQDLQNGPDVSHQGSENSSVSGDVPGICEYPFFTPTASSDIPAFAEQQVNEDDLQKWKSKTHTPRSQTLSGVSRSRSNSTAFVNETPSSESLLTSFSSRPRNASSTTGRPSAAHMPLGPQSVSTIKKRKQRNSTVSVEQLQEQSKPLQIVQEDGQGGAIASADFVYPPRGARRKGPLSTAGRANAGLRRKNKDTCVQCRLNKRKCDGHSPCDACRPTLHEQPCARACFANIVEFGTCNYISQRAINHPTTDGLRRVRMEIPSAFDLNDLLSFLNVRQGRFNIRASQPWGSLYVLDLGETYKFLKSLTEYNGNARSTFLEFIDRRIVESKDKSKNWLGCLRECDPMNHAYALLSQWNNMPSRACYSFVPLNPEFSEQPMDVDNDDHKRDILMAAQLSRIFCRMLEVEGFRKLERDFYNIKWKQISHETHFRFLNELGHILLSLRWRVSWWKRLGDGSKEPDPSQQHYVDRVEMLCRILYVYYTCVLAKLPAWSTSDVPKGIWSTYADVENPIWDDFPLDPTDDGFQRWMERGRDLIEEAGVPRRVSKR